VDVKVTAKKHAMMVVKIAVKVHVIKDVKQLVKENVRGPVKEHAMVVRDHVKEQQ
jgi:ribosomal protein S28E/S33